MGAIFQMALEIVIFMIEIMSKYMMKVKPDPVKVRVDSNRKKR